MKLTGPEVVTAAVTSRSWDAPAVHVFEASTPPVGPGWFNQVIVFSPQVSFALLSTSTPSVHLAAFVAGSRRIALVTASPAASAGTSNRT